MLAFGPPPAAAPQLVVHEVGDYEASFVPAVADFGRLDPRFRMPPGVWDALPQYADWGFAVFKLKDLAKATTGADVHPMAFELPRRDPSRLFFPTVHVHDGRVHPMAVFDHTLYCQTAHPPRGWTASLGAMGAFVDADRARGVVVAGAPGWALAMRGQRPNEDTYV